MTERPPVRVAVTGDYEGVVAGSAELAALRSEVDEVVVFTDPLSGDEVVSALERFNVIIAIRERTAFPAAVLEQLGQLELLSQAGTHANHVHLPTATEQGILVACGRGDPSGGTRESTMAELSFGMLFGLLREIPALNADMASGGWRGSVGRTVRGLTLGVLGMGRHGVPMTQHARMFGMDVLAWGPTLDTERAARHGATFVELDDLLARCDVLSIHLRLTDLSRNLIDERRIGLMKPGAIIINTARGEIVDEDAMVAALRSGRLGGACLDVFSTEPLPVDHPLRGLDNAILTPHVGFTVDRHLLEFAEDTTLHITNYLGGRLRRAALLNPDVTATARFCIGRVEE